MVVAKGFKKSVAGDALSCACDVGNGLLSVFQKNGIARKSREAVLICNS